MRRCQGIHWLLGYWLYILRSKFLNFRSLLAQEKTAKREGPLPVSFDEARTGVTCKELSPLENKPADYRNLMYSTYLRSIPRKYEYSYDFLPHGGFPGDENPPRVTVV